MTEWYDYQYDFVNKLNTEEYIEQPLYKDIARISEVIVYKHKVLLKDNAEIKLYGDRITVDENLSDSLIFDFNEISAVSVLGRNKLNIYYSNRVYQFKGDKRFNALKYVNIFYRSKNIKSGDLNAEFLGI